jgi:hypothetical protein
MRHLICLFLFLTSCSMYRRHFDECPVQSVPCTPVTTLEKMIVESPSGDDLFIRTVPKLVDVEDFPLCRNTQNPKPDRPFQRRIWLNSKECEPIYLYFDDEEDSCEAQ